MRGEIGPALVPELPYRVHPLDGNTLSDFVRRGAVWLDSTTTKLWELRTAGRVDDEDVRE